MKPKHVDQTPVALASAAPAASSKTRPGSDRWQRVRLHSGSFGFSGLDHWGFGRLGKCSRKRSCDGVGGTGFKGLGCRGLGFSRSCSFCDILTAMYSSSTGSKPTQQLAQSRGSRTRCWAKNIWSCILVLISGVLDGGLFGTRVCRNPYSYATVQSRCSEDESWGKQSRRPSNYAGIQTCSSNVIHPAARPF